MFDDTTLASVGTLWDHEYFSRSWITQETSVSAHLMLICGRFQVVFNEFIDLTKFICLYSTVETRNQKTARNTIAIRHSFQKLIQGMQESSQTREGSLRNGGVSPEGSQFTLDLFQLLSLRRDLKATDPRDKVYAFLGLSRDAEMFQISPGYSISVDELYNIVAIKLLLRYGPAVLSASQPKYTTIQLPSWVPDWSLPWRGGIARIQSFECGAALVGHIRIDALNGTVTFSGMLLDVVKRIDGTPFDAWGPEPRTMVDMEALFEEQMKKLGYIGFYTHTRQCYGTVLLEVLTAGRRNQVHQDPVSMMEAVLIGPGFDWNPFDPEKKKWDSLYKNLLWKKDEWDIFETENGYIGLGPRSVIPGDVICILPGAPVPYILRPAGESTYQLIGDSYIHGIMMG
ncbi:heterokaryon incompatibility protein [Fusarium pseudocircinatum]|uniref:Heterokaryon incompatibility protein n=1 Tax=Fusarium pseudocircinatum TaxID=56676 RepID=A0A8H5NYD2_9HYPO|nr:heterokaryon incompatibility protein [Fusarium pseudocircinatum]